jgi:pimeloyl-ACP methyl ester carboxylesterase
MTTTTTVTTAPGETLHDLQVGADTIAFSDSGGDGEAVLLVHAGVFGAWFVPLAGAPELAGFRVIRMVRAGYTDRAPAGHVSVAAHAAHCAALLDHLGATAAHVVGHSSGSVIVLQLAADRPDLVRTMVLSEPPLIDALADPADLDALHARMGPAIGRAIGAAAAGDTASAYDAFMDVVCGPGHRDVLVAALGADAMARAEYDSRYFLADEAGAAGGWEFADATRVTQPALLVLGGASPPPEHHLVAHLAGRLPAAEVATIDGENHLLPLRSPDALGALVAEFARRHAC